MATKRTTKKATTKRQTPKTGVLYVWWGLDDYADDALQVSTVKPTADKTECYACGQIRTVLNADNSLEVRWDFLAKLLPGVAEPKAGELLSFNITAIKES